MAYEESANRITEFVFGTILGVFILLITIILIRGIQNIYNTPVPEQMKLIIDSFSGQVTDMLKYKDLVNYVSMTALHLAEKIGQIIQWIIKHIS